MNVIESRPGRLVLLMLAGLVFIALPALSNAATLTVLCIPGVPGDAALELPDGAADLDVEDCSVVDGYSQTLSDAKKNDACSVSIVKPVNVMSPNLWMRTVSGMPVSASVLLIEKGEEVLLRFRADISNGRILAINSRLEDESADGQLGERLDIVPEALGLTVFRYGEDHSPLPSVGATVPCG